MDITRSAKSSCDWNQNDLLAYNISVSPTLPQKFFSSVPEPSLDCLDADLLNHPATRNTRNLRLSLSVGTYMARLDLASPGRDEQQQPEIVDFAFETLKVLGFREGGIILTSSPRVLPLEICAELNHVVVQDLFLLHMETRMLLILGACYSVPDFNQPESEPQVIADAIAVFRFNNKTREERGLDPLPSMTIPCIMMTCTRPTFYLVPVTQELSNAVAGGVYPRSVTQVLKCAPPPRGNEGMENPEYRKLAIKCFLAFKTLAKDHWSLFLEGTPFSVAARPSTKTETWNLDSSL